MSKPVVRIRLEPELEAIAADFNAHQCRIVARLYARWARQLRVKAQILEQDSQPVPPPPLRPLSPSKLPLN